jgi:hypothetical protein
MWPREYALALVTSAELEPEAQRQAPWASESRRARLGRAKVVAARWGAATLAFTTLAIILTWPWARDVWGGRVGGDAAQFVWDAWWVKERVFSLENPWWTGLLYAPEGTRSRRC